MKTPASKQLEGLEDNIWLYIYILYMCVYIYTQYIYISYINSHLFGMIGLGPFGVDRLAIVDDPPTIIESWQPKQKHPPTLLSP